MVSAVRLTVRRVEAGSGAGDHVDVPQPVWKQKLMRLRSRALMRLRSFSICVAHHMIFLLDPVWPRGHLGFGCLSEAYLA